MHVNHKVVLALILISSALSISCAGRTYSAFLVPENARGVIKAAYELARQDFPDNPPSAISIAAMNDIVIEPEEVMANAVIIAEWPDQKRAFTITHIHFGRYGTLISGANVFWWRTLERDDDWKASWCNFLNTSLDRYKQELKAQGCE